MIFATFISVAAIGQTQINFVTGVHYANVETSGVSTDFLNIRPLKRISAGVLVNQKLDRHLDLRTGLVYKQKGFNITEGTDIEIAGMGFPIGVKVATELNTINVPLMIQYNLRDINGITPYISAGTGLSYATSGFIKTKATAILDFTLTNTALNLDSDDYKRFGVDGNVALGANIPYGKGHFITEINYSHALTDFTSDNFIVDAGIRTKGIGWSVGYGMRF